MTTLTDGELLLIIAAADSIERRQRVQSAGTAREET